MDATQKSIARKAMRSDNSAIINLLGSENLPTQDLPEELSNFFVVESSGKVIGAIGMEIYDKDALLRSLVVDRAHRNQSVAATLVTTLLAYATDHKISSVYLITTTAEAYFATKGFSVINREYVPKTISTTAEFSTLCPSTATVMVKPL